MNKQQIKIISLIGAFIAFIMLGYLGIRNYKDSVEKLKINKCIEEISQIVLMIKDNYTGPQGYAELDYKKAIDMNLFPQHMIKKQKKEALNSFSGGVDIFYSPINENDENKAFEVSFQGLSSNGCQQLMTVDFNSYGGDMLIAVGGYPNAMPSGTLADIYPSTKQKDIKDKNIYKSTELKYISQEELASICNCKKETCSVVWKFN